MPSLTLRPNAKINLGLLIKGKRPDGYHELETIFLPAPLHDTLILTENSNLNTPELRLQGISLQGNPQDNLCIKAWKRLKEKCPNLPAVEMELEKKIPAGAGLGGGSSDAAFVLKGLIELFSLKISDKDLLNIAVSLGADVPFFLTNRPCLATGIGEILEPIDLSLPGEIRLVLPPIFSDTRLAYQHLDYFQTHPELHLMQLVQKPYESWKSEIPNDFESSVFQRFPELQSAKENLYAAGAIYASMSGSGSALYGIFPTTV